VNRTIFVFVLVLDVAVGFMGCTPYQTTLTNAERSYPPTTANNVQLFLQGEHSPKATEIGEIILLEDSQRSGIAYLQEKAAEMGADGVIDVEVKIQTRLLFVLLPIPIHSYFVSGTAVKYMELSRGASQ
jgi:uncharacterized protein YbjQ (UPF0145 family)